MRSSQNSTNRQMTVKEIEFDYKIPHLLANPFSQQIELCDSKVMTFDYDIVAVFIVGVALTVRETFTSSSLSLSSLSSSCSSSSSSSSVILLRASSTANCAYSKISRQMGSNVVFLLMSRAETKTKKSALKRGLLPGCEVGIVGSGSYGVICA
jgi:hypothetical protein